jgi:hypothetical protein
VAGGDFNDSVWDRFTQWVDRTLEVGDRVEFRVVQARPAPGRRLPRSRRVPLDEWPSHRNPGAVGVPGAVSYPVTDCVLVTSGRRRKETVALSPSAARKLGLGLVKAAETIKARRAGRRRPRA